MSNKSLPSIHSRVTAISKITTASRQASPNPLDAIKEEDQDLPCCEVCRTKFSDLQDVELNQRINAQLNREEAVRRTYNEYRRTKGLQPIDFTEDQITKKPMTYDDNTLRV